MKLKNGCYGLLVLMILMLTGCGTVTQNTGGSSLSTDQTDTSSQINDAIVVPIAGNVTINAYGELPLLTYNSEIFSMKTSPIDNVTYYGLIGLQSFNGNADPLLTKNKIITGWRNDKYGYCDLYYFSLVNGDIYRQSKGPQGISTVKVTLSSDYAQALISIAATLQSIRTGSVYMGHPYFPANPKVAQAQAYIKLIQQMIDVYGGKLIMYNDQTFAMKTAPSDSITNYALIGVQSFIGNSDPLLAQNKIITGWKNDKYGYCDLYYFSLRNGSIYRQTRSPQTITTIQITNAKEYNQALTTMAATLRTIRDGSSFLGNPYFLPNPYVAQAFVYINHFLPVDILN